MDTMTNPPLRVETLDELAMTERRLVELLLAIKQVEADTVKLCAPILKRAARRTAPLRRDALKLAREIDAFARKNKRSLTDNGKKVTVKIPNGGELKWRKSKPAVKLDDEDAVLSYLLQHSKTLELFIRRTPSVNKIAMAEHPIKAARVPGVSIEPNRKFVIAPKGVKERLERASNSKKFEIVTPRSRA
jgi:phage host-nuclease inhibitor protein Gam